jgi:hypothetical protein
MASFADWMLTTFIEALMAGLSGHSGHSGH